MSELKVIYDRAQGCWSHPALFEVGKATGPCREMRSGAMGPCPTRSYKTRDQWCEQCAAHAALDDLAKILEDTLAHSKCKCDECQKVRDFLKNGDENKKLFGLPETES